MKYEVKKMNEILKSFKINAECVSFHLVGNYSYYDLVLGVNGKVKDLNKYSDEISLQLKSPTKPGIKIIREKGIVRLEFVSNKAEILNLFDYFTNNDVPNGELIALLGKSVEGEPVFMNLCEAPHMIVAGATGSGKSVFLHVLIASTLNYSNAKIFLMDPKRIEFAEYKDNFTNIHVSSNYSECLYVMKNLVSIMEARYEQMEAGIPVENFPPVLVIVDELADIQSQDEGNVFYDNLCVLAQKCRAAKIHIVVAMQRPSVDVIRGAIKANFPARVSFKVASHTDSKVIMDQVGAEHLRGAGDGVLRDNSRTMFRFQSAYTTAEEVCKAFGSNEK